MSNQNSGLRRSFVPTSYLSKLTQYLPQSNVLRIAIAVSAILIIAVAIYIIHNYFKNRNKVSYKENNDISDYNNGSSPGTGKDVEILRFFATWCPACKKTSADWEKIKLEYKGKTVNGYNIVFTEVDCTHETPEIDKMMDKYKIEGYPTIKLIKDGKVYDFDTNPTQAHLEQFINTVVV